MQKFKQITNRQATVYSRWMIMKNILLMIYMILSNSSWTINRDQESKRCTSVSILDAWEHLTAMIEMINSKCNSKIIFVLRSKSK